MAVEEAPKTENSSIGSFAKTRLLRDAGSWDVERSSKNSRMLKPSMVKPEETSLKMAMTSSAKRLAMVSSRDGSSNPSFSIRARKQAGARWSWAAKTEEECTNM